MRRCGKRGSHEARAQQLAHVAAVSAGPGVLVSNSAGRLKGKPMPFANAHAAFSWCEAQGVPLILHTGCTGAGEELTA